MSDSTVIESDELAPSSSSPASSEVVVLLHGLGGGAWVMRSLAKYLEKNGMRTIVPGYATWRRQIEEHVDLLDGILNGLEEDATCTRWHLVGHSMGCVISRATLQRRHSDQKRGRLVMLAPPNRGSFVAAALEPMFGRWFPPLKQLSSRAESYVNSLEPQPNIEFGVVVAEKDLLVHETLTQLVGEVDRVSAPSHHGELPFRGDAARHTLNFLKHGAFEASSADTTAQAAS